MHPVELGDDELLRQCDVQRTRRSGPGGQHRNKVETAVVLVHRPTGIKAEASERRSQHQNQQMALARLRTALALGRRGDRAQVEVPSSLWRQRCRGRRIVVSREHRDFAILLAEALDVLASVEWNAGQAAETLGCSTSQLVKLLQQEPAALEMLNRERAARQLKRLK